MTGARQKASLGQSRSAEKWDGCPRQPHADNMERAWTERSLRFGRTKRINEIIKGQGHEGVAKRISGRKRRRSSDHQKRKPERRRDKKKRDRKSYPLRGGRGGGGGGGSEDEGLSCHVLLTRLDEGDKEEPKGPENRRSKHGRHRRLSLKKPRTSKRKGNSGGEREAKITTPKSKSKSNGPSQDERTHVVPEPRKRRLASLNAEAVNSLLLERATSADPHQPAAKQAKRQQEEPSGTAGASLDSADPAKSGCPPPAAPKATRGGGVGKASPPHKLLPCQSSKRAKKKAKACPGGDDNGGGAMSQESLDAPAPRRLAGLNAAALLRLTGSSASSKQRVRATPTATVTADCKAPAVASSPTPKQQPRVKLKPKECSQKPKGEGSSSQQGGPTACTAKAGFEPKVEWETGSCTHRLTKPGYQQRSSMLAYPLKSVKEEQVEAELSPYYCCPPEGSVEYCHRLAFFLGQEAYRDPDDQSLNSAMTPVKRECLVTSPSLTHSHPHAALALSPHPCLCTAEHCFSHGYYVHIAHPTHTGTAPATLAPRPLNFGPSALCPNGMAGSKLLGPRGSHPSGLAHPAFCGSVGSPCYGQACRISGCAYRGMPPVTSRGCTFSTGCTGCTHSIKTESYSSSQGEHSPSLGLVTSPALPLSGCPLPSVPPSSSSSSSTTQAKPHLLPTPLAGGRGREQPPPLGASRPKLARECPQSAKPTTPSDGSVSSAVRTTRLSQKQPSPTPVATEPKPKRISRRRATNGWRPVGVPTEKEVFIAGEEETSLRQCYEGVERDGEVIRIRDTVLLRSGPRKKSLPYVAKISALWEDPKTGEMMMSLFWYYRPEHTQGGRDPSAHCENEIFASRHQDENSVACIEDRCYVLPLAQYCRFCALVKRRAEGAPAGRPRVVPGRADFTPPSHRCVPADVDPDLVYLCRHVYDFRYGRILKNLQ